MNTKSIVTTKMLEEILKKYTTNSALEGILDDYSKKPTVGEVRIFFNNVSPAEIYGGSWEKFAEGQMLIGANSNFPLGSEGGSNTITLTTNELPAHDHTVIDNETKRRIGRGSGNAGYARLDSYSLDASIAHQFVTSVTGEGKPFSIMNPYKAVYFWKKIA